MRSRWFEPARRKPEPRRAPCGCPVAGPDEFGAYELMERWDCPVHGVPMIPLRRHGEVVSRVLVDAVDYERFGGLRWTCDKDGYGVRTADRNGKRVTLRLHREILGLEPGDPRQGDHVNGDVSDCRRANLRALEPGLNQQNRRGAEGRTSAHRGVHWNKRSGKWYATAGRTHLGQFDSEAEAARVASEYRREHMPASEMDREDRAA